jgi:RNA recognition motif-containing protein
MMNNRKKIRQIKVRERKKKISFIEMMILILDQCHLWVSNIAKETHASDLKELFSKYGKVRMKKQNTGLFNYLNRF